MKILHTLGAAAIGAAWLQASFTIAQGLGEPGGTCSDSIPCYQGCCSKEGSCGFTPDHCGDGCKSNCNATAECGQYAAPENFDCPINVCCSGFGYCGITSGFCGDGCEPNSKGGGCGDPDRPTCSADTDAMSFERRIGYYVLDNVDSGCNVLEPESLIVEPLSHINLAFVNFDDGYNLVDDYGDIVNRVSFLKFNNPGLRVNIVVGGWVFSDLPTQPLWTAMTRSYENRQTFITSVVRYLSNYHLDGIDLDWEYPSASDRGGDPDDAANFVTLLAELREAFDNINPGWEISATVPTSYWYLRGFDVEGMNKYLSYFNLMSYDLHGMWDQNSDYTGPYLEGHTDITQIEQGLDLLWRNDINASKVVFGFAFYGRSFTMKDPSCHQPNGKCEFSGGGKPGSCTHTTGILSYAEISSRNSSLDVNTYYDKDTTVKYNVYQGTQWISYDDQQSFQDKKEYASKRCLGGWMIWAINQDNGEFDALSGLVGEDLSSMQLEGGDGGEGKQVLADTFAAYTGQKCLVTDRCTDGSKGEKNPDQVCPSGYLSVDTAHNPLQAGLKERHGDCDEGWYRYICCPKDAMPKNCEWNGAPERSEFGCDGACGNDQFKLNQDTALDAKGEGQCYIGARWLCCDSTAMFSDCHWNGCDGPLNPGDPGKCPDDYDPLTYRLDQPDGEPYCSDLYNSDLHDRFKSELCCPSDHSFSNCAWANVPGLNDDSSKGSELSCVPHACPSGKVKVASALDPPAQLTSQPFTKEQCASLVDSYHEQEWSFCCDPPTKYNKNWPVDPKYLWDKYYDNAKTSDVVWKYSDDYSNNDADHDHSEDEDGSDAYGFVMLDGPEGSIDNSFSNSHTVVRRSQHIPNTKRSLLTTNQTHMDGVFDHAEETIHVYCNYPANSRECQRIFVDGAEDTIIRLPDHVGEGPFARVVSLKRADEDFDLPDHHLHHRSTEQIDSHIYEMKIDYNFHAIKLKRDDEPVNIRVDYTNLIGYWDEMTDSPASRMKRGMGEKDLTKSEWRARVQRATKRDSNIRKREEQRVHVRTPMELSESRHHKRWWGAFTGWLERLTTVTKSSVGVIELGLSKTINLFNAQWGCAGSTYRANLQMDLEADLAMDATYAYYLSGTFIPPSKPEAFAYFGMEPEAYLGLHIQGNAQMQTTTGRKKIVDTLTYPGLAVKGIAAVGPTLDVFGEIRGKITLYGEVQAGATLSFGKAEVYWPQDDDSKGKYEKLLGLESDTQSPAPGSIEPVFHAGVGVDAQLDVIVTPEANVGIKIGGGKLTGGTTLMDAQLTGYVEGDLSFQAHGDYDSTDDAFHYRFGAYLFYNLGFKAKAQVLNFINWALSARTAYSPRRTVKLYDKQGTIPMSASDEQKRDGEIVEASVNHSPTNVTNHTSFHTSTDMKLFHRSDEMDIDDPNDPEFTQNLKCPPGSSDFQVPELRFNCGFLWGFKLQGSDPPLVEELTGLCQPILQVANRIEEFTFTSDSKLVDDRRKIQCPDSTCLDPTKDLNKALNRRGLQLQCDEFPWASTEQGGDWLPSNMRSQTCVPSWQNNWHGQCVKMMGAFQSNWKKLDPDSANDDERKEYWVPWGGKGSGVWTTRGDHGPQDSKYTQDLKEYPVEQPPPDGVTTRDDNKLSWKFKRDYKAIFIHEDPSQITGDTWWGATSHAIKKPKSEGPAGMDAILCAVNHFAQDDTYKLPTGTNGPYNAYCRRDLDSGKPTKINPTAWNVNYNMATCLVTYGQSNSNSNTKREWHVESIKMVDEVAGDLEEDFRRTERLRNNGTSQ